MKFQRTTLLLILLAVALVAGSSVLIGGCAKKLEGTTYENEKPVVWFVNVPPENSLSSTNPIVNWIGQDRDGQIDFYRYIVVREDQIGAWMGKPGTWNPNTEPLTTNEVQAYIDDYLLSAVHDTMWTVLLVRADSDDPHTSNIIPMSAQISDPVRTFVPQFVFVQAYDEEGLGSEVAFRRFLRNDNPPATRIQLFVPGTLFINSVLPSGSATGIRFQWEGSDAIDYPTDAPPFQYQWRLLGPYDSTTFKQLTDSFKATVFVTNDAQIFEFGLPPDTVYDTFWSTDIPPVIDSIRMRLMPTAYIVCDTTYEGGVEVEVCDTIYIDFIEGSNVYGTVDTLFKVFDPEFENSTFYKVADSSQDEFGNSWVYSERDSIYNAFWNQPSDTTQKAKFIFAVRCRDDAEVPDLTPAYATFDVIDPQHERDVLVMNWAASAHENKAIVDSIKAYWLAAIEAWKIDPSSTIDHSSVVWNPDRDFIRGMTGYSTGTPLLEAILKYKVFIIFQDGVQSGGWNNNDDAYTNVLIGLQTGVNVWVMARVPTQGHGAYTSPFSTDLLSGTYQYFFGMQEYTFPGWGSGLRDNNDGWGYGEPRAEDFIGALTLDPSRWPDLHVDTANLHNRYEWKGSVVPLAPPFYPWRPDLGALPQVGWCVRTYETEAMYLFESMYGQENQLLPDRSFHGRPVGLRLNRGLFRTVQFLFTPLSLDVTSGQSIVSKTMSWLYDGRVDLSPSSRSRSQQAVSSYLQQTYWDCYWQANGDRDRFYELLRNSYR
jgi:hypothetical protein